MNALLCEIKGENSWDGYKTQHSQHGLWDFYCFKKLGSRETCLPSILPCEDDFLYLAITLLLQEGFVTH